MKYLSGIELIKKAEKGGYAVPAFCAWNAEIMNVILKTAAEVHSPVIVMQGPSEFLLLSPVETAAIARALVKLYDVTAALHYDHGDSLSVLNTCLDAGFTSVMLDYSTRPYQENVNALKEAVLVAKRFHAAVEGELGAVGKVDDAVKEGSKHDELTDPRKAREYVEQTGVDMLAVSIGNKHGMYTTLPKFDFHRLQEIHESVPIPLVLHGGSTTPEPDIKRSVDLGIRKINLASELVACVRESLKQQWTEGKNTWLPVALAEATKCLPTIIRRWMKMAGSEGMA
nr:class II fructose-bisphosphate aldolase [Candidatus Sigynarchaeum springense]